MLPMIINSKRDKGNKKLQIGIRKTGLILSPNQTTETARQIKIGMKIMLIRFMPTDWKIPKINDAPNYAKRSNIF